MSDMLKKIFDKFIHFTNDISIRSKILILVYSSIIFFVVAISFFTFKKVEGIVNQESGNSMIGILGQTNNNIDYNIKKSELSINTFFSSGKIKSLIVTNPNMFGDKLSYLREVKQQVFMFKSIDDSITDMKVFSYNKEIRWDDTSVYSADEIENQPWLKALTENHSENDFYWTNSGDRTWNKFSYVSSIYCYKAIMNEVNNKPLAVLRVDVNSESIFNAINSVKFGKSGVVFVVKENGNLVYFNRNSKQNLGNFKERISKIVAHGGDEGSLIANIDGISEFLVFSRNNKLGWYVIGALPHKELKEKSESIKDFIIVAAALICLMALGIVFLFSGLLSKRIIKLSYAINKFGKGDFEVSVNVSGNDEVGQVAHNFKMMAESIKELVIKVEEQYKKESALRGEKYELEILKKEAELCALQTQINPHFLYNTLEMIKGLLFSEDPQNNIINATQALSDMFKYNLNTGYLVKVKNEIQHIQDYLTIQNFRYDRAVHLELDIDEFGLNSEIIRFTLEPIVENAIIHGFRGNKADSRIFLVSGIIDDKLVISVRDDGKGIDADELANIREQLQTGEYSFRSERKGGLGIYNVNARIKKYFGSEYGLDISSVKGQGTTVFIFLPVKALKR